MSIDWDNLTNIRKVPITTYVDERLPEGQFVCPICEGKGVCDTNHGQRLGRHYYHTCLICMGTGKIKKCKTCDNPIPVGRLETEHCSDCCYKHEMKKNKVF